MHRPEKLHVIVLTRLPKSLADALAAKSEETGAPMAELVRRAVAERLRKPE